MQERYTVYTLVDITETNVTNARSTEVKQYNQQQNLNTLIQLIGLRSQPIQMSITVLETQDLVDYEFGNSFKGLHTVWKFEFASEHLQVYEKDNDPVFFLKEDCDGAAFTPYLDETVNFLSNTFETLDPTSVNIYFLKCV